MLTVAFLISELYADCHYAECHYANCEGTTQAYVVSASLYIYSVMANCGGKTSLKILASCHLAFWHLADCHCIFWTNSFFVKNAFVKLGEMLINILLAN
jgi:hypothetical protein